LGDTKEENEAPGRGRGEGGWAIQEKLLRDASIESRVVGTGRKRGAAPQKKKQNPATKNPQNPPRSITAKEAEHPPS